MLYINHLSKKEMDKKNNDGLLEDMPEKRKKDGAFVRVGTTLYKLADMPLVGGGFVRKRIVWNNETLRQDYGRDYLATVPKYDGFCTVPDHVNYQPVVGSFPISRHWQGTSSGSSTNLAWTTCNYSTCIP